jgi:SAM-dependent methyltransferase
MTWVSTEKAIARYCVPTDVLIRRLGDGSWVASNPRVHSHVGISPHAAEVLVQWGSGASLEEWGDFLAGVTVAARTAFTNADGLLADPSGIAPAVSEPVSGVEAVRVLRLAWILCLTDWSDYEEYLQPLTSVLDRNHLGTFHQNVGRHLLLDLRLKETWRWWHDQKFASDGLSVRDGPYRWMQLYFFDRYFADLELEGKHVLDFACGNGFYSRRFADQGASVLGVDTSSELIEIAKANHPGIEFVQPSDAVEAKSFLDSLPAESFEIIYVSDALLFFFFDPKSGSADPGAAVDLLRQFQRLLTETGRLYIMEPNGTFWLTTHGGSSRSPIALVTEYRNRLYHVAPTADRVISALGRAGFAVVDFVHPPADPEASAQDREMYTYALAFPLWDYYVCARLPQAVRLPGSEQ